MKSGDKYLSGEINLGLLGKVKILVFKNEKKEAGSKQPDYNICVTNPEGNARKCGGLWNRTKKEAEDEHAAKEPAEWY